MASFSVSAIVTQAARMPAAFALTAASGAISVSRPIGVTAKQTSNPLYLVRVCRAIRSSVYRRLKRHFAFRASCGSLTPDPIAEERSKALLYCLAQPVWEEDGSPGAQESASKGGCHAPCLSLFSYTYSIRLEPYPVQPRSGQPRPQSSGHGIYRAYIRLPGGVPRSDRRLRAEIHTSRGSDACGKV